MAQDSGVTCAYDWEPIPGWGSLRLTRNAKRRLTDPSFRFEPGRDPAPQTFDLKELRAAAPVEPGVYLIAGVAPAWIERPDPGSVSKAVFHEVLEAIEEQRADPSWVPPMTLKWFYIGEGLNIKNRLVGHEGSRSALQAGLAEARSNPEFEIQLSVMSTPELTIAGLQRNVDMTSKVTRVAFEHAAILEMRESWSSARMLNFDGH